MSQPSVPEWELVIKFPFDYTDVTVDHSTGKLQIRIPFLGAHAAHNASRQITTSVRPSVNRKPVIAGKAERSAHAIEQ